MIRITKRVPKGNDLLIIETLDELKYVTEDDHYIAIQEKAYPESTAILPGYAYKSIWMYKNLQKLITCFLSQGIL